MSSGSLQLLVACLAGYFWNATYMYFFQRFVTTLPTEPPSLPEELQDWESLLPDTLRGPWEHYAPFLTSHGISLYEITYDPEVLLPSLPPPCNAFLPTNHEDFVHRLPLKDLRRPRPFFPAIPTGFAGMDRYCRDLYIKAVPSSSDEWKIVKYLSSSPLRSNSWNHTVPVLSILQTKDRTFIVQALWGSEWTWPPCDCAVTRLGMAQQLLQGLAFMHQHGVAHGDIHPGNIVCNHEDSRPAGADNQRLFHSTYNLQLAFIDFGSAVQFPLHASDHVVQDRVFAPPAPFAAPEQADDSTFDIFSADVYSMGKLLEFELDNASKVPTSEMAVVCPAYKKLMSHMTLQLPSARPTAAQALHVLDGIFQELKDEINFHSAE